MPNPNRGNFVLQIQLPEKTVLTNLALYSNLGIKVWQQDECMLHGPVIKNIALQNKLPAGTYILMIERSDITLTKKVVISK
ncbi:MAG: T9SS type A sorting domain-containing protein [Panacibacter sp.]